MQPQTGSLDVTCNSAELPCTILDVAGRGPFDGDGAHRKVDHRGRKRRRPSCILHATPYEVWILLGFSFVDITFFLETTTR